MIVFLIGGTGNQIFQLRSESDVYSTLFLKKSICGLLNWSVHPYFLCGLRQADVFKNILGLFLLSIDIFLVKLKFSPVFGVLDLRGCKGVGRYNLYAIGYFQESNCLNNFRLQVIRETFRLDDKESGSPLVLHIRGGDILTLEQSGENSYGILPPEYYKEAMSLVSSDKEALVITNDPEYATKVIYPGIMISSGSLLDDFRLGFYTEQFISSSSTLSFWIIRCREKWGRPSIIPRPFSKNHNFYFSRINTEIGVIY